MCERFTDRARKVMQLAGREAKGFNHEFIGTEHILLGLIRDESGVAANVLKSLEVDVRKVRLEVEKIVQTGPGGRRVVLGRLPHTPRAQKAIEYAVEEARSLKHNHVGTEHLLLGLLREREGVAGQCLTNLGLNLEDVREQVTKLPRSSPGERVGFFLGGLLPRLLDQFGKRRAARHSATPTPTERGRDRAGDLPPPGPGPA